MTYRPDHIRNTPPSDTSNGSKLFGTENTLFATHKLTTRFIKFVRYSNWSCVEPDGQCWRLRFLWFLSWDLSRPFFVPRTAPLSPASTVESGLPVVPVHVPVSGKGRLTLGLPLVCVRDETRCLSPSLPARVYRTRCTVPILGK